MTGAAMWMLVKEDADSDSDGEGAAESAPQLAEIFERCSGRVWRTLRRLGVRESDVEDVCQEVFLIVSRKLGTFRGDAALTTWIYGICVRAAADHRRRAHVRREEPHAEPPEQSAPGEQEEIVARREALRELDRLLGELDENRRTVFVLFELEGLPMNEVARVMGCPAQTCYYRLYSARRELEAKIAELGAKEGAA
ncbi:MAG: sigma-70 family RNA polymerase sigma factor [Polyangiaceae bacterium]